MVVGLTIILINRYFNLNYGLCCLKKSLMYFFENGHTI